MQIAAEQRTSGEVSAVQFVITFEFVAYFTLLLLSIVLRIAELDTVPLLPEEARQALASWQVVSPSVAMSQIVSESPLLLTVNNIMFSILGSSETSARLLTAVAGVLLTMSPLLFRPYLGRTRAFIITFMLSLSPVLLVVSRMNSGAVWAALFIIGMLWALARYWESKRVSDGVMVVVLAASAAFLAEPGGLVLVLMVGAAGAAALWLTALNADMLLNEFLEGVRARFAEFPLQWGGLIAGLTIIVLSTGFMFYPSGLSAVAELIASALRGVSVQLPNTIFAAPLFTSLFYEPFLWIFALGSVVLLRRRAAFTFVERFLTAWLFISGVISLLYAGGAPVHALWLTLPLVGLASYSVTHLFVEDDTALFWGFSDADDYGRFHIPGWSRWFLAGLMIGLLVVLAVHLQYVGRLVITFPRTASLNEVMSLLVEPRYVVLLRSLIWVVLVLVFASVGYLLAASVWGNITALQGGALGFLLFSLITSAGSGWNAAVANANSPTELFHLRAVSSEVFLLRQTLQDFADRRTGGFLQIPVVVVLDPQSPLRDDGTLAWILRDFSNVRYVRSIEEASGAEFVISQAIEVSSLPPNLGGNYVGQRFTIQREWDTRSVSTFDFIAWWTQRRVRQSPTPVKAVILWVRQDVFDGVSANAALG